MARGKKRKADEQEEGPDAMDFAEDFCSSRLLCPSHLVGTSDIEKACIQYADLARQAYKEYRDDPTRHEQSERDLSASGAVAADDSVLTSAQKYSRRLKNNRKSAAASKVYAEVLRRAQASALQKNLLDMHGNPFVAEASQDAGENTRLKDEVQRLEAALFMERKRAEDVMRENTRLKARNSTMRRNYDQLRVMISTSLATKSSSRSRSMKTEDFQGLDDSEGVMQMCTPPFEVMNTPTPPHPIGGSGTQESFLKSQPSQFGSDAVLNSEPHPMSQGLPAITPTREHKENANSISRLVVEKHSSSLALSNVGNESDAKVFATGLTCSQSQGEDIDDRNLPHPSSLPMSSSSIPISSSGLPSLLPSCNPSQELDPDLFLNSQGNSQGKTD